MRIWVGLKSALSLLTFKLGHSEQASCFLGLVLAGRVAFVKCLGPGSLQLFASKYFREQLCKGMLGRIP